MNGAAAHTDFESQMRKDSKDGLISLHLCDNYLIIVIYKSIKSIHLFFGGWRIRVELLRAFLYQR